MLTHTASGGGTPNAKPKPRARADHDQAEPPESSLLPVDGAALLGDGSDPEAYLMLRVAADDPEAFEELVGRYWQPLVRILRRKVGSEEDAQDLVQDVFLRVYQTRKTYTVQSKFSTWLYTIAFNLARNVCRARQRKPSLSFNPQIVDRVGPIGGRPVCLASADLPMQQMEKEELIELVRRAIEGLDERQRLAVVLNGYAGMRHTEIADAIGLTPQAVKSLLCRARGKLRRRLAGYFAPERLGCARE